MKLIRFLKPDSKKILVFLIILSPIIIGLSVSVSEPVIEELWYVITELWIDILLIPVGVISIFYKDWDTGSELFLLCLTGGIFWYVTSCAIATRWNHDKNTMIYLIETLAVLMIISEVSYLTTPNFC